MQLGQKARDRITGFSGVVTGRAEYLSGCAQCLVVPPAKADGSYTDGVWLDEQRLDVLVGERIVLDNTDTPGPDVAPARRT